MSLWILVVIFYGQIVPVGVYDNLETCILMATVAQTHGATQPLCAEKREVTPEQWERYMKELTK